MTSESHPRIFHRTRRDHNLRLLFSNSQRLQEGRGSLTKTRQAIESAVNEALYHAREVLRDRSLEWPETVACDPVDRDLEAWLQEMEAWIHLAAKLTSGEPDVRPQIRELIAVRLRHGQALFHTRRPGRLLGL